MMMMFIVTITARDDDDVYYYIRWRLKLEGEMMGETKLMLSSKGLMMMMFITIFAGD